MRFEAASTAAALGGRLVVPSEGDGGQALVFDGVTMDSREVVPGQGGLGSSYALLLAQLQEAVANGEVRPLDPEVTAIALYGAARRAGEFVIAAADRAHAAAEAMRSFDLFLDGLRTQPRERSQSAR